MRLSVTATATITVTVILGTRPEAIKLCPLCRVLTESGVATEVILSGQHRDMVAPVLDFFGVRPTADLGLGTPGQTLPGLTARLLTGLSNYLTAHPRPDAVLVHGDTTTALCGALAAFYAGLPVVHVEAGLRSGDLAAPFPEEFNRRAIDAMSTVHFAPTAAAAERLRSEGADPRRVFLVGNTATDALRLCLAAPTEAARPWLERIGGRRLLLLTSHRRELSDTARRALLSALRAEIAGRRDVVLIAPVHPSPLVASALHETLEGCPNIQLTPPLELPVLQQLLSRATLLLTDSGGLQEEATYLGLPTLVLRNTTERPEGVAAGVLRVAGTSPAQVRAILSHLLDSEPDRAAMAHPSPVYGDGHAAERMAAILQALYGN